MDLFDDFVFVGHQLGQAGILDQALAVELRVKRWRVDVVGIVGAEETFLIYSNSAKYSEIL